VTREALVAAARHLARAGLSPGSSGNLSMIAGDRLLVTPTGSSLSRVAEEDLAEVALDGTVLRGKPTKELAFHLAVYHNRVSANAVVHLHSPWATAVSCLPDIHGLADLPPTTPYRVMRLGAVPLARYATPGSADLGTAVGELASDHGVILLANHGSVVAGDTLDSAVDLAEELETACQLTVVLRGHPHTTLDPDEIERLRP
jgi:ribulose-5-phosphate 4-epimerase/fuculose-1-phosphate aldolase